MTKLDEYVAARVIEEGDCLIWNGTTYGGHPGGTIDGVRFVIRRALYEQKHGPIPKGRILRCTCQMKLCVNLEHVRLTTYKSVAKECGALGLMSGHLRSAKIAAAKRAGSQAKLTDEQVREFRLSGETGTSFAARTGICIATACKIKRGEMRKEYAANPWAGLA